MSTLDDGPLSASKATAKYAVIVGVFVVICLLNFLISNLPTFLDMALLGVTAVGAVVFGRKTTDWF